MKRIMISYSGRDYSIMNADPEKIKAEILDANRSGQPMWLRVNDGEGTYREADLLIAPGIPVTITGIDAE
jgi:hypothetical protein